MSTTALRRLAVGLVAPAALVIGLSACGGGDASRSDVQKELEDGGLSSEQATCVTDSLFEALDQGQINDLYEADDETEVSDEINEATTTAIADCSEAG